MAEPDDLYRRLTSGVPIIAERVLGFRESGLYLSHWQRSKNPLPVSIQDIWARCVAFPGQRMNFNVAARPTELTLAQP